MDNPIIKCWPNGIKKSEEWLVGNERHRPDGPAYCEWNEEGILIRKEWRVNDRLHRIDGPAYRRWNNEKVVVWEEWRVNGEWHRIDGPALLGWNSAGVLTYKSWYVDGFTYTKETHPFNKFCKEHKLPEDCSKWPEEYRVLFRVTYG